MATFGCPKKLLENSWGLQPHPFGGRSQPFFFYYNLGLRPVFWYWKQKEIWLPCLKSMHPPLQNYITIVHFFWYFFQSRPENISNADLFLFDSFKTHNQKTLWAIEQIILPKRFNHCLLRGDVQICPQYVEETRNESRNPFFAFLQYTYTSVDVPTTAVAGSSSCSDAGPRYFILHLFSQTSYWYLNFTFGVESKYALTEVGIAWTVEPDIFPNPKDESKY